jgi:hypothetical protein
MIAALSSWPTMRERSARLRALPIAAARRALQAIAADAPEAVAAAAGAALDDGERGDCTLFRAILNAW